MVIWHVQVEVNEKKNDWNEPKEINQEVDSKEKVMSVEKSS